MSLKKSIVFWLFLVLALLCIVYGMAIYSIRSGTLFYTVWFFLAVLCVGLAFSVKKDLWKRLSKKLRTGILVICALFLALFLFVEALILSGFDCHGEPDLDYIIVLGAQVREDGPSYVLMRRLQAAQAYLEANPQTLCIVSGGQGDNEPFPEAVGMARYLTENGVDAGRILLEDRSSSTVGNIQNSMAFIPEGASVGIVTNNFHIYRAVETAKRCGLTDVCGIAARMHPYFLPNNMLREFLSVIKFWIIG